MKQNHQAAFDQYAVNALNIIHDKKVSKSLIKRLKGASDTVEAVGDIALDITHRIEQGANMDLSANTVLNGLNMVVGEIVNLAEAAGANPLDPEQKYQAFSWALSRYMNNAVESGKITPQELQQMKTAMEQHDINEAKSKGMMPQGQQMPQPQQMPQEQPKGLLAGGM